MFPFVVATHQGSARLTVRIALGPSIALQAIGEDAGNAQDVPNYPDLS